MASVSLVLIDTWWNVNYEWDERGLELVKVLIDTWWNVNEYAKEELRAEISVLIDTWWNVNFCRICRSGHVP